MLKSISYLDHPAVANSGEGALPESGVRQNNRLLKNCHVRSRENNGFSPHQTRPTKNKHEGTTRPDQTEPHQTSPDQARPAKNKHEGTTRPDQTNQTSQENVSITSYFQKRRFWGVRQLMFCLLNQCFIV